MMKKIILAALATSVVASPVLAAPHYQGHDNRGGGRFEQHHDRGHTKVVRVDYRKWQKGQRFDSRYARNYRVIDARSYRLREAPRGYRWVRSGNDAVMIGITSGIVAAVMANVIR